MYLVERKAAKHLQNLTHVIVIVRETASESGDIDYYCTEDPGGRESDGATGEPETTGHQHLGPPSLLQETEGCYPGKSFVK